MRYAGIVRIGFIVAFACAACGADVQACSCAGPPAVEEARAEAELVLACRVVKVEVPPPSDPDANGMVTEYGFNMTRYTAVPLAQWKGAVSDTLIIFSRQWSASCGYVMASGGEYLLYVQRDREPPENHAEAQVWAGGAPKTPIWVVGLCSRNSALAAASEDIELLGPPIWRRDEK